MATHFLSQFPVRSPRGGGTLQASLCPPPWPVPRRYDAHQGNHRGKESEQKEEQRKSYPAPQSSCADAMKEGVGRRYSEVVAIEDR